MNVVDTEIADVKIITPQAFEDDRGYFKETYRSSWLEQLGCTHDFVQDNISRSYQNTIRGLHYQKEKAQAKLVQCIYGEILDVAVDLRTSSPTFGHYFSTILSEKNHKQLYIPEGFAHGFQTLEDDVIVNYCHSSRYSKPHERGVNVFDKRLNINWPIDNFSISERDNSLPNFDISCRVKI